MKKNIFFFLAMIAPLPAHAASTITNDRILFQKAIMAEQAYISDPNTTSANATKAANDMEKLRKAWYAYGTSVAEGKPVSANTFNADVATVMADTTP